MAVSFSARLSSEANMERPAQSFDAEIRSRA
jgi:hypothetical protein